MFSFCKSKSIFFAYYHPCCNLRRNASTLLCVKLEENVLRKNLGLGLTNQKHDTNHHRLRYQNGFLSVRISVIFIAAKQTLQVSQTIQLTYFCYFWANDDQQ